MFLEVSSKEFFCTVMPLPLAKLIVICDIISFSVDDNVEKTGSTRLLADQFIGTISAKASTPVSLLVESLVQQLCIMLEPDPDSSNHLYNTICGQLHKMNLIDKTYEMGEFEVTKLELLCHDFVIERVDTIYTYRS